jgi:PIN domain nuclease of toxin-antitoxin system
MLASATQLLVSTASLWEIAMKVEGGKLTVPDDLPERVRSSGLGWLPVTPEHAWGVQSVTGLPHRDPFDRMLIAQASCASLTMVTADRTLLEATVSPPVRLVDARG